MWQWIVIGGFSALAGALMLDDSEPPNPPPPVQASPSAATTSSLDSISGAMYWVGGCSVVCSSIGAFTVISLAKLKRRNRQ